MELQSFRVVEDSLPEEIFYGISKSFEERFEKDQVNFFRTTDLGALKRELKRVQDAQERERALQNLRRIENFIKRTEQFRQVLHNIPGAIELMHFIWGPVKSFVAGKCPMLLASSVSLSFIPGRQRPPGLP
jgi:hypothetical protein